MKDSKLLARIGMIALAVLIFATMVLTAVLGCMYQRDRYVRAASSSPVGVWYFPSDVSSLLGAYDGEHWSMVNVTMWFGRDERFDVSGGVSNVFFHDDSIVIMSGYGNNITIYDNSKAGTWDAWLSTDYQYWHISSAPETVLPLLNAMASKKSDDPNDYDPFTPPDLDPIYYTVQFNANGGQFVGSPSTAIRVESGSTIPSSSVPQVSRSDYTFLGWSTSVSGSVISIDSYTVTGHVTLYAQWQAVPEPDPEPTYFTVVFNSNGGQFVGSPDSSIQVEAGTKIPSPSIPTVTRAGYTFLGWAPSGGDVVDLSIYVVTNNVMLYAQWQSASEPDPEPTYYTVYFDANAATVSWSGSSAVSVVAGSKVSLSSLPIVTSTVGHEFIGWFTLPTGGSEIDWDTYQVTDDVTVFAHWGYKITFNANGGSFPQAGSLLTVVYDSDANLSFPFAEAPADPFLTDYEFLGWFTDPHGGSLVNLQSWSPTGNTILYAHWDLIVVPPDPGGDSGGLVNPLVFFITPIDSFFSYPIFGTLSIGDILQLVLFVFIGLIFLRMFAGG